MPQHPKPKPHANALNSRKPQITPTMPLFPHLSLVRLLLLFSISSLSAALNLTVPSDATALLAFKSKADLRSNLRSFSPATSSQFCQWQGVTCQRARVVRVVIEHSNLSGIFPPDSLTRLDQLRVLSLQNNSLTGPIPDLSGLINLKTLFLDHNAFTGAFPPSIFSLHRIRTVDLSSNSFSGPLPSKLTKLDRLYYLRLDSNRFNGTIPALNQSSLQTFNVSANNLTGPVPVTPVLSRFGASAFSLNPHLCGEIVHKECRPGPPFFNSPVPDALPPSPAAVALGQSAQVHGGRSSSVRVMEPSQKQHKRTVIILGFSSGVLVLVASLLCFVFAVRKQRKSRSVAKFRPATAAEEYSVTAQAAAYQIEENEDELEEKVKRVQGMQVAKSGNLVFCAGEVQRYTLEQLMRASAELLGRGSVGTTYKAVMDNGLIVSVKRLDGLKLSGTSKEVFEGHMEAVGGLRHPNLVPLRAYFQAITERLLIYDFHPNGSLHSLIHGSKSAKAKPLHWTSCLKIAEDIAQGLSYIHQAWRLVHGNLKSSNILLGADFEACITDYCLSVLVTLPSEEDDPNLVAYSAPEIRHRNQQATNKSDVYAYGVLLLELLTSKPPAEHPHLAPNDMMDWVRSTREDDGGGDDRLSMLLDVALACSSKSPEQRPTMWQVLKMLQEIKEALMDESELDLATMIS